ncbi:hypothetical protein ACFX1T_027750 [Malus domestica]
MYSSETRFGAAACKNKPVSGVGPVRRVPPQSGQYLCGGRRGILFGIRARLTAVRCADEDVGLPKGGGL